MIRFMCIYCGQKILAHDGTSGKQGKCPKCSHALRIPWTLKGRPGIGGTKIESLQDNTAPAPESRNSSSGKTFDYIPGFQNDKPPTFDVVTLYGEKPGWLIPIYDDQSLFLIAFTLLLILLFNRQIKYDVIKLLSHQITMALAGRLFFLFPFFLLGFLLSFYHVFTKRKKTRIEKYLMLFFAVTANAIIGIAAGIYVIRQCPVWQLIFPIWNIINSILMLLMFEAKIINETCIIDRKATPGRIVINFISMIIIFALCNYLFKLHWAVTFSICTIYTASLERSLQSVLTSRTSVLNAESV